MLIHCECTSLWFDVFYLIEFLRTWRQQEMAIAFTWLLLQRRIPIPASCIRTYADFLIHDDIELRKV